MKAGVVAENKNKYSAYNLGIKGKGKGRAARRMALITRNMLSQKTTYNFHLSPNTRWRVLVQGRAAEGC